MDRNRGDDNRGNNNQPHLIPENREERAARVGQDDFDPPNPNLRQAPQQREIIARQQQENRPNQNNQSFRERISQQQDHNNKTR